MKKSLYILVGVFILSFAISSLVSAGKKLTAACHCVSSAESPCAYCSPGYQSWQMPCPGCNAVD